MGASTPCKACEHPKLAEIDAALTAGQPQRAIAERFGLSPAGVSRHHVRHRASISSPVEPGPSGDLRTAADRLVALQAQAARLSATAQSRYASPNVRTVADRELRATIEAIHRIEPAAAVERQAVDGAVADLFIRVLLTVLRAVGRDPERDLPIARLLSEVVAGLAAGTDPDVEWFVLAEQERRAAEIGALRESWSKDLAALAGGAVVEEGEAIRGAADSG